LGTNEGNHSRGPICFQVLLHALSYHYTMHVPLLIMHVFSRNLPTALSNPSALWAWAWADRDHFTHARPKCTKCTLGSLTYVLLNHQTLYTNNYTKCTNGGYYANTWVQTRGPSSWPNSRAELPDTSTEVFSTSYGPLQ